PPRYLHSFPTRRSSDLGSTRRQPIQKGFEQWLRNGTALAVGFSPARDCVDQAARTRRERRADLPISLRLCAFVSWLRHHVRTVRDRKSTRLNSSHRTIS